MSLADLSSTTLLLLDAFDVLDENQAQAAAHRAATAAPTSGGRPGVLR